MTAETNQSKAPLLMEEQEHKTHNSKGTNEQNKSSKKRSPIINQRKETAQKRNQDKNKQQGSVIVDQIIHGRGTGAVSPPIP